MVVAIAALAGCARQAKPDVAIPRADTGEASEQNTELRSERRRDPSFLGEGLASYYGPGLAGNLTANGERFDPHKLTAAHRKLPFGTCVRVKNLANGLEVHVRINDRGPYAGKRIIDLSKAAALKLGMEDRGVTRVRLWRCD